MDVIKRIKKTLAMLLACVTVMNLTAQPSFAVQVDYFPKNCQGVYRHPDVAKYLISITGSRSAVFEGEMYGYGISAASAVQSVAIDPDRVYNENFAVVFGQRSIYSSTEQGFVPTTGTLILLGTYDHQAKTITIPANSNPYDTYTRS